MPHAVCAHCGVRIVYHDTMVERDGKTYCCANCAAIHEPAAAGVAQKEVTHVPHRD
jgi:DNA-directed RNA polymerase subunit RPC12/RpoP